MNAKTTRRALLSSVMALVLCVTMLMGTTFAWFTDTATVKVNTIQSGTLDIDLIDENNESLDKKTIGFKTADGRAQDKILWEPGCTYELDEVNLINNGNLHAKFLVTISAVNGANDGDIDLAEVIDVYEGEVKPENKIGTLRDILKSGMAVKEGNIAPNGEEVLSFGTISLHMQETAGNDYQNKSITNIAITVYATQYTAEYDSVNNIYDENAEYPFIYATAANYKEAVAEAMKTGVPVVLAENVDLVNDRLTAKNGNTLTVDLNGNTISGNDANGRTIGATGENTVLNLNGSGVVTNDPNSTGQYPALILANNKATVTINGGEYRSQKVAKSPDYSSLVQNEAHVVINGGVFTNNFDGSLFNVIYSSTLEINGGHFESIGATNPDLLDVEDHNTRISTIIIRGGTFVNYDPRTDADDWDMTDGYPRKNILIPEGYTVVSETQANGDVWYSVVPE